MVGVMDPDQIGHVASSLKAERDTFQRKAEEIRARPDRHSELPDLSPEALAQMPGSAIKDAPARAVQGIATEREGIIVLTSFGTYIGARICSIPKGTFFSAQTKTTVAPQTPEAAASCLSWLPSPEGECRRSGLNGRCITPLIGQPPLRAHLPARHWGIASKSAGALRAHRQSRSRLNPPDLEVRGPSEHYLSRAV